MGLIESRKKHSGETVTSNPEGQAKPLETPAERKAPPSAAREPDALYQRGRIVARILDPEVDLEAREIRFDEISNSDELLIPEECEFQKYRILIQRVGFASKLDRAEPFKGRVLRGVTADILGFREP